MPYHIVKRRGPRPYKIIRDADGVVVGSSTSKARAARSIGHRMGSEKDIKNYKRKVSNKMHGYGDLDLEKRIVRINKSKKKNKRGEILDTIVHEKQHILHPKKYERNIRKVTKKTIGKMTKRQKQKHYNLFAKKKRT